MQFRITTPVAPVIDPGWLFLLAGIVLIGSTILIPAADDLAKAQWERERAEVWEARRQERIENYKTYLGALERAEPQLVQSLASSELNLLPEGKEPLPDMPDSGADSATIFGALEPKDIVWAERPLPESLLYAWTTDDKKRLWLIVAGAVCCLVGLLPSGPERREDEARAEEREGERAG